MYFALQEITSLAKDNERRRRKKRDILCHCFREQEQQSVNSPQIALLNSLAQWETKNIKLKESVYKILNNQLKAVRCMVLVMNLYNIYFLINNNCSISKLNLLNGVFLNDQDLETESHRCIHLIGSWDWHYSSNIIALLFCKIRKYITLQQENLYEATISNGTITLKIISLCHFFGEKEQ